MTDNQPSRDKNNKIKQNSNKQHYILHKKHLFTINQKASLNLSGFYL